MIKLYKKISETPLQALERLRAHYPELQDKRLSYAGRLDPMACGILPVLVGEENDRQQEYFKKDKAYTFEVLFGVSTDTYDLLGLPTDQSSATEFRRTQSRLTPARLQEITDTFVGKWDMKYPPYSSQTVALDGQKQALWEIARAGRLDEIDIPINKVEIYSLSHLQTNNVTSQYVIDYIHHYVGRVDGDFRQEDIINSWGRGLLEGPDNFVVATFCMECSAGTYVRKVTHEMGEKVGVPACVFSLLRTRVGGC